ELEALGELRRAGDGVHVEREALGHFVRPAQNALAVAAPLALGAVEARAVADRDEDVLERFAARMVRMDVAGDDGRDAERGRQVAERRVAPCIAAFVRALELDIEALRAEGGGEPR